MKIKVAIVALAAIAILAPSCKNGLKSNALKNGADSISYCFGLSVAKNIKTADIQDFNMAVFEKAFNDVMDNKKTALTEQEVSAFAQQYFMALQMKNGAKNKEKGTKFLDDNKKRSGVTVTASGLQYEVVKEGTGQIPAAEDKVSVHYKGTLIDGTTFDSSYDRGQPATFPVSGVIPGWTEALQLMKVGSKYKVYIPSDLAYGAQGAGEKIKPNSVLIFEMELLSIEPKDKK